MTSKRTKLVGITFEGRGEKVRRSETARGRIGKERSVVRIATRQETGDRASINGQNVKETTRKLGPTKKYGGPYFEIGWDQRKCLDYDAKKIEAALRKKIERNNKGTVKVWG